MYQNVLFYYKFHILFCLQIQLRRVEAVEATELRRVDGTQLRRDEESERIRTNFLSVDPENQAHCPPTTSSDANGNCSGNNEHQTKDLSNRHKLQISAIYKSVTFNLHKNQTLTSVGRKQPKVDITKVYDISIQSFKPQKIVTWDE